jgi:chemotaxis protein methyltransferase CheR
VTISFSGKAYRILVDLVYEHSRIRLGADKQTLLANRLQKRLRMLGLKSYDDYCAVLESPEGSEEIEELVDLISTNHTKFFREPDHLSFLVNQVLPALIPRLVSSRSPLRLWSAAASSGEEPYTMAIVVAEHLRAYPPSSGRSPPRISPGACLPTLNRASIEWMPFRRCPRSC